MDLRTREAIITRVCFAASPDRKDLEALGFPERWQIYRDMVRTRLLDMVRTGLPRTAQALGAEFDRLAEAWLDQAPPQTRYIREVVLEFHAFAVARWNEKSPAPPWVVDLARYEATRWDLAHGETAEPSGARDFDFEAVPVLGPAIRVLSFDFPVHRVPEVSEWPDHDLPPLDPEATRLVLYRRSDNDKVGYLTLTNIQTAILKRWMAGDATAKAAVEGAAKECGVAIDGPFVTALGTFSANLLERTILLGSRIA